MGSSQLPGRVTFHDDKKQERQNIIRFIAQQLTEQNWDGKI